MQVMQNPDAMLEVLKFACEDNAQVQRVKRWRCVLYATVVLLCVTSAQVPLPRHSVATLQVCSHP